MRVLMMTWEYPPYVVGGMGKHVAELIPALAGLVDQERSIQIDVVTTRAAGGEQKETLSDVVTVHRVDVPPIDPIDLFNSVVEANRTLEARARQLADQEPYDLVHTHDWLTATAGIALKHAWRVPLVATIHATERGRHQSHLPNQMSQQINQLEWTVCFEAWRIIVCSGFMAGELSGYFNLPLDKISVIPNGIDPLPFQRTTEEKIERLRERHAPVPRGHPERLLFFVGRITPEKGLQILLRAMPFVLAQHPHTRLLVAGKNSEQMEPLVQELKIKHAVTLLGFISNEERNSLYAAADAAIFPSLYEPFGIVALEAMAAGCSVIASDVGGMSEVLHHMHNGLTVIANSPRSIAWAVNTLFSRPEEAAVWRQNALREVETLYSWHKIANHTLSLYQAVLKERETVDW